MVVVVMIFAANVLFSFGFVFIGKMHGYKIVVYIKDWERVFGTYFPFSLLDEVLFVKMVFVANRADFLQFSPMIRGKKCFGICDSDL